MTSLTSAALNIGLAIKIVEPTATERGKQLHPLPSPRSLPGTAVLRCPALQPAPKLTGPQVRAPIYLSSPQLFKQPPNFAWQPRRAQSGARSLPAAGGSTRTAEAAPINFGNSASRLFLTDLGIYAVGRQRSSATWELSGCVSGKQKGA